MRWATIFAFAAFAASPAMGAPNSPPTVQPKPPAFGTVEFQSNVENVGIAGRYWWKKKEVPFECVMPCTITTIPTSALFEVRFKLPPGGYRYDGAPPKVRWACVGNICKIEPSVVYVKFARPVTLAPELAKPIGLAP